MKNLSLAFSFLPLVACTWKTDLPSDAKSIHVDASRELLVTDDALLASLEPRLGFPRAMGGLALHDGATLRWLDAWSERLREEDGADRASRFDRDVTCRWLRRSPSNACDETCSTCAKHDLPAEAAPFRLIAIANRTDLSVLPDRAADGGEGRLVFGLEDEARAQPLAVIFEYAQIGSARDWAARWHALGGASDFPQALASLALTFVGPGAIAQIRTADASTGAMTLHQFELENGEIVPSAVRNTPDWSGVNEAPIRTFAAQNADALAAGTAVLPRAWWARSSSTAPPPAWAPDSVVKQTCGGCHAQAETGFQLDPRGSGDAKVSQFLRGELDRRTTWMQLAISGEGELM
ncbi:MAG TPA: hypothetical protein VIF62_01335 [Labilithrix sp.]